jgi:serine/threonine-protein kinase HipA
MAEELAVWLNGTRIAVIDRRLRMAYTDDALRQYQLGVPLLCLSLPLRDEPYPQGVVRAFLDGLLPESAARRTVAKDFGVRENDTFGLIQALGRDSAGALVIQPVDDPAPAQPTTRTAEPLSDEDIADLVANLRSAPLGAGGRVRISLAGVQEKLLLTRMPDGAWGRPVDNTPSTHILKPEIAAFPNAVENEAFCMRVAQHLGLDVAPVETTDVLRRKLIVIERYDRVVHDDGSVERLHQEDFCQAAGMPPDRKYEEDGGPSLRRIAGIVQAVASRESVETLLRAVTLNVLIGNGDAHAKNFSLLHEGSGGLRLAPLYDLMSTLWYGDDRLAMYIDDVRRTDRVTGARLINEATRWGLTRRRAAEIIEEVLDRTPDAVAAASTETAGPPSELLKLVKSQVAQVRSQFIVATA